MYEPHPLDTSKIDLPAELTPLVETLAEHVHEVWAKQRIDDGWTLGSERNDELKTHPCLVPYDELPESEKEYDRKTALEAIKVLLLRGATLEFKAARFTGEEAVLAEAWNNQDVPREAPALVAYWEKRPSDPTAIRADRYCEVAKAFKRHSAFIKIFDILQEGLKHHGRDIPMRQMFANTLNKVGAHERARDELSYLLLRTGRHKDVAESFGILGSAYKSLAQKTNEQSDRQFFYRSAFKSYFLGFECAKELDEDGNDDLNGQIYTGPNAATVALLIGNKKQSRQIATQVIDICNARSNPDYWTIATLAECHLLCENKEEAEKHYRQAIAFDDIGAADKATTRCQARVILELQGIDPKLIDQWMPAGAIVVFRGHMLDKPGDPRRLSQDKVQHVRQQIGDFLDGLDTKPLKGFSSAACGSDLIFLEEMRKRGINVQIVLPFPVEKFKNNSVSFAGPDWRERFDIAIDNAGHPPMIASQHRPEQAGIVYTYANQILLGRAMNDAERLDASVQSLVVWDGRKNKFAGGVSGLVNRSKQLGIPCHTIPLENDAPMAPQAPMAPTTTPANDDQDKEQEIRAMLFADVKGFSKLPEIELPSFANKYLARIGDLCREFEGNNAGNRRLIAKNTWGDGLFFVFPTILDAGEFAFRLCDLTTNINWHDHGFSKQLGIRIALHAGPVYPLIEDPVTDQPNFLGNHVSQAARIEPITPVNQIYASDAFAALTKATQVSSFTCDYVGPTPLAKGYGTFPTFHVRRIGAK